MTPPRVVLDTNCVLSALLFAHGKLVWLREGWRTGRFIPLASRETVAERIRVLTYPKFGLAPEDREDLLADFLPYVETVPHLDPPADLPELSDPDDLMFLVLAVTGEADALVSGDAHLLAAKERCGTLPILTATEFAEWLKDRP
jgi:putative PIN family toxin of toxin-antitoxin system